MEKFLEHLKKKSTEHVNIAKKCQEENEYLNKKVDEYAACLNTDVLHLSPTVLNLLRSKFAEKFTEHTK
eukprot:CAMPEP_0176390296 /NCGR_PEP_ID=MMETSP0126-20121128/39054_1 /TAXON_ID=141414 ORGANISM="Strombidinopsis acuminatum, Strain SPMC142" /NCGR_SAMPLE_ID=MMETSP0126 /ASSEMBLY_ACC=CAM_ASM_000229 /LENGTH=68 /DNA_ID=CAMNT_0017759607 /DNA_START=756 /DNA_END=962 /DNA_ORIENTATION=+